MTDFEDKVKDRWKERRKKAYNWPKILIMLFVLVAIFYAMNRLGGHEKRRCKSIFLCG
jgi:hypothetical protein